MAVLVTVASLALIIGGAASIWRSGAPGHHARRWLLGGFAVLLVGATLARAPAVDDRLPYLAYVDEGHVLHPVQRMIANGTWDPEWYRYPSLTMDLTALGAAGYRLLPGDQQIEREPYGGPSDHYDLGLAPAVIVTGRLVVLLLSVATVAMVGVMARRLDGAPAAAVAAGLAAVLPALVHRSAIVNVHAPAAFFVVASATALVYLLTSHRRWLPAAVAGASAGMAFTSMYVAGAVMVLVLTTIALMDNGWRWRLTTGAAALASWGIAVCVTMPAFLFRWSDVWEDIGDIGEIYTSRTTQTGFSEVLFRFDEVGWVYVLLAIVGTAVLANERRSRPLAFGIVVFLAVFRGYLGRFGYQPLQVLVPLYPLMLVLVGVALNGLRRRVEARSTTRVGTAVVAILVVPLSVAGAVLGVHPSVQDPGEDSRSRAVEWLVQNVDDGPVVVAQELAVLPSELDDLPFTVSVARTSDLAAVARRVDASHVVVPTLDVDEDPDARPDLPGYGTAVSFGRQPTPPQPQLWRTNEQRIHIEERTAP